MQKETGDERGEGCDYEEWPQSDKGDLPSLRDQDV
jgi:hypothetical protein